MGLKIADAPRELRPELIRFVWPGDSGVDLDQSNLAEWMEEGGVAGLVPSDEKWDEIHMRKLDPDEMQWIGGLMLDGSNHPVIYTRIFAMCCVSIDNLTIHRTNVAGGIPIMRRDQVNALAKQKIEFEQDGGSVVARTLPDVIGQHIFVLSFSG